MEMSDYLRAFLAREDESIREMFNGPGAKMIMWMHNKTRITEEDLARKYTEEEVRELCLRTKVKVKMTSYNCLWDAKKRFDAKKRLENQSSRFINAMYLKAVRKKMVQPYDEEYIANQRDVVRAQTKKLYNHLLDSWHGKTSAPDWDASEAQSLDEDPQDPLEGADPPNAGDQEDLELSSDLDLQGIGDLDEDDELQEQLQLLPDSPDISATQMNESWVRRGENINSESLSIGSINTEDFPSTQNSVPDYDLFNTQVTASTQESPK
ncbi:telomere-binding protein cav [Drosophila takahashii]|uniref:telomere-binding protein cav n=1 Tax=Drosophila takahashii TaxID=29030 RepID=UPI001CF89BBC|nr:telomere-binding protein cav [Drosophila takahashii]